MMDKMQETVEGYGMRISVKSTRVMNSVKGLVMNSRSIQESPFNYRGCLIIQDGSCEKDFRSRIA